MSDNTLMIMVKDGDLDKLGLLFERYHRRLFGFFFRLTSRRDISEDLVQAVFERILRYRKSYNDNGAFSTWIFRIARNLHTDHYKQMAKIAEGGTVDDWDSLQSDDADPQAEVDDANNLMILLQRALEKLDPEKRQALILSRYQGFKYREIAEIMQCTESAVKVRVFRAINELKEIITHLRKREKL